MSDELAQAEALFRVLADPRGDDPGGPLAPVLAEYDRRGVVEQAATALVEHWEAIRNPADKLVWTIAEQLTERLAAAVRTETP